MVRSITCRHAAQHKNPVPNAAVHNGLLMTSGILGTELETGRYPEDKARQFDLVFRYLKAILEEAGGTLQDVVKLDLYLRDKSDRDWANAHWLKLWPDAAHRPARQAHEGKLPEGCYVQIAVTAVLASFL